MKNTFKVILLALIFLATIALCGLYISANDIAVLSPKGIIAKEQRKLLIDSALTMLIVVVPVFILTFVFAWVYREDNTKATHSPDHAHSVIAELVWWGVPLVIIAVLAVWTYRTSHELNPFKPLASHKKPLEIQVVALEWKWLFIYPEQGIATINSIVFPKDTPINFSITADAPMNSFWIPELGGMIYAMPAMRTELHLMADTYGTFRGVSSHLSGTGFAGMTFTAESTTEEGFRKWVRNVQGEGTPLNIPAYKKLLVPTSYDPVSYYTLGVKNLFSQVLMKYMKPGSPLALDSTTYEDGENDTLVFEENLEGESL